jgi:hypothetical protein
MESLQERFERQYTPEPNSGCWLWAGFERSNQGYGGIQIGGRAKFAHRVSWELHRGPIPDGLFVLHKCDVPSCVNPDHLFLGTKRDNAIDRHRKGRTKIPSNRGEINPQAKLTWDDVVRIRLDDNRPHREIAADYGVVASAIGFIKTYRNWRRYDKVWRRHGR